MDEKEKMMERKHGGKEENSILCPYSKSHLSLFSSSKVVSLNSPFYTPHTLFLSQLPFASVFNSNSLSLLSSFSSFPHLSGPLALPLTSHFSLLHSLPLCSSLFHQIIYFFPIFPHHPFFLSQPLFIAPPPSLFVFVCPAILRAAPGSDIWRSPLCYCHPLTQLSVGITDTQRNTQVCALASDVGDRTRQEICQVS